MDLKPWTYRKAESRRISTGDDHRRRSAGIGPWFAVVLAALLLTGVCTAAPPDFVIEMKRHGAKHYHVFHNLPEDVVRRYADHMDTIYRGYLNHFAEFASEGGRVRRKPILYLFQTQMDYVVQLQAFGIEDAEHTGGMFFIRPDVRGLATFVGGRNTSENLSTLQHEGFHQFSSFCFQNTLPQWAEEGLAEYYGDARVVHGRLVLGSADQLRIEEIHRMIGKDRVMAFKRLMTLDRDAWWNHLKGDDGRGHEQYVQSWSLVHFLLHHDGGRHEAKFKAYLRQLVRGRSADEAFELVFGTNFVDTLAAQWLHHFQTIEPDPYSAALMRLRFLGRGLQAIHASGGPVPQDLERIEAILRQSQYRARWAGHAGIIEVSALNDANYTYTDAEGQVRRFELLPPADETHPPSVTARHLDPQPVLRWQMDGTGQLTFDTTYLGEVNPAPADAGGDPQAKSSLLLAETYLEAGLENKAVEILEEMIKDRAGTEWADQAHRRLEAIRAMRAVR